MTCWSEYNVRPISYIHHTYIQGVYDMWQQGRLLAASTGVVPNLHNATLIYHESYSNSVAIQKHLAEILSCTDKSLAPISYIRHGVKNGAPNPEATLLPFPTTSMVESPNITVNNTSITVENRHIALPWSSWPPQRSGSWTGRVVAPPWLQADRRQASIDIQSMMINHVERGRPNGLNERNSVSRDLI